ncbi:MULTISPECIES: hypothetical protein [Chitinophagaceae]
MAPALNNNLIILTDSEGYYVDVTTSGAYVLVRAKDGRAWLFLN